jgi:HK97 family phage prohead protease
MLPTPPPQPKGLGLTAYNPPLEYFLTEEIPTMSTFEMKTVHTLPINRIKAWDGVGNFFGYASTFGNTDKANDVIVKGAFSETLQSWKKKHKGFPNIYDEHNRYHCLGTCKTLEEDDTGLSVEGILFTQYIEKAREAYECLRSGLKHSLSIGFYVKKSFMNHGVRYIEKIDLLEVSIVTNPCNAKAQIHAFKRDHDPTSQQAHDGDSEKLLHGIRQLTKRLKP